MKTKEHCWHQAGEQEKCCFCGSIKGDSERLQGVTEIPSGHGEFYPSAYSPTNFKLCPVRSRMLEVTAGS